MPSFRDLGLAEDILAALDELGYTEPTPVQEQSIPELLAGRDVIGQAQTGTGKTAAFGLPLLQYLDPEDQETQALVLTPTRELCIQVTQARRAYAEHLDVEVMAVFGGQAVRTQQSRLRQGAHLPVRSPNVAVLGDHPAADRATRGPLHVRPGDDPGDSAAAHG